MAKHKKIKEKLFAHPPPSDLTWSELKSYLERIGYTMLKSGGGSSRKFYHKDKDALFLCHQPHPNPCVDKGCIIDLVEHLKINGFE